MVRVRVARHDGRECGSHRCLSSRSLARRVNLVDPGTVALYLIPLGTICIGGIRSVSFYSANRERIPIGTWGSLEYLALSRSLSRSHPRARSSSWLSLSYRGMLADESSEVVSKMAIVLPIIASIVLMLLFFFFDMIYYGFLALLSFSAVSGVSFTVSPLWERLLSLIRSKAPIVPTEIPYVPANEPANRWLHPDADDWRHHQIPER